MNERARDLLVKAAMERRQQITGMLWDGQGGACTGAILLEGIGYTENVCRAREMVMAIGWMGYNQELYRAFRITKNEWERIVHANDVLRWDFLTIARKFGTSPEGGDNT